MIEYYKPGYIAAECDCSGASGPHLSSRMDDTETLGQFWKRLFAAGWKYSPLTGRLYCPYCAKEHRWMYRKVRKATKMRYRRRMAPRTYTSRRPPLGSEALTVALAGLIATLTQKLKD